MKLLTVNQVAELLQCSKSHVYNLIRRDQSFPKPIDLGVGTDSSRAVRWLDESITEWMKSKAKEANSEPARDSGEVHKGEGQAVPT